jgi:hypothetical protein
VSVVGDGHAFEVVPDQDVDVAEDGWFDVSPDDAEYAESTGGSVLPDGDGPPEEQAPRLRVAPRTPREVLRRRRRARLAVFGVAALSAASMFTLVAFHVFAAQAAFSLDKLDTQLSTQQREYGLLRDQVATLSSPDAVAKAALALGMVRPSDVTLLHAPSAASFASSNNGLPAPPPTPYTSVAPGP